ncbi:uncharacterized protein LOC132755020 isoform X1 [Ruditapes philippinarum]|uniref:uncharacterized protein LOC132755020 isoform X1 n=1 Tax=Ruditapes philippinarum TaxID=129788 RepID=UPI00295B9185|nr:uncharacterized protein LOC132755020 isoform X1 [Ruditapes philippinarum]
MSTSDFLERGSFEFEKGNFKQAEEHLTAVIKADNNEDKLDAYRMRASCRHEMKQYQDAIVDAKRLLELNPKSTSGYALWGCALSKLGKFEEALATFRLGLDIDTNDSELKKGLKDMQVEIMSSANYIEEKTYDAVKMSSQDSYPGDSELEVLEKEIMQKWGMTEFPPFEVFMQDPKMAVKEYGAALQLRKAGNDDQALQKMKEAMKYDAANFTLRGEIASLLYEMGRYKEAYQHCQCIPGDFRPVQHWKLGGQILDALNLPVHAEAWLRQGCKLDKNDKEMPLLFQNIRVKRLYGPLTDGTKVNVVFTQFGRAIVASENISPGENCFRDKPAVLAQTLDTQHVAACLHCAKCLMLPVEYFGKEVLAKSPELKKLVNKYWPIRPRIECTQCGQKAIYCSVECREESWAMYHQVLCVSVNPAVEKLHEICEQYKTLSTDQRCYRGVWNASFSPFVLANIWARIICMANSLAAQEGRDKPTAANWTMAKSPYRKFIAYGNASNAAVIPKMVTVMQEVFDNEYLPVNQRMKINNKEFDGRYFQATCNVQAFSDPSPPFNVFLNNVSQDPRGELVRMHTLNDPDDAMFAGMFPLHACLNHSCDNNVEVLDGVPGVLVRAKKSIQAGEELYTTYINTKMPKRERRAWLFRGYNFWCQCTRCKFEGEGPELCTECGKEAKTDKKEKYPGCGKCHRAWYCSTVCQKTAWKKGHKKICSTPHSNTYSSTDYYLQSVQPF